MSAAPGGELVTGPSWQLFGHSQIGSAHIRRNAINQDYVDWCCDSNGLSFAAAVADGHGAPPYFRSDIGAKFAVQAALVCLGLADHQSPDAASLAQQIQSRWCELVLSHVAQNPYPSSLDGGELLPYGSTLIAAGASARWLVTAQIGDGDAYIGFNGQALHRIDASQDAFEGEQTLSLCMPDAASQFTINIIDLDWVESAPDFLVLCTDGVAKSFPTPPACLQAMNQFRQLCTSPANRFASLAREIPTWLSEVSQRGSGDDASMLIATRGTLADVW